MANDLNQCNFIGRLGKDPETRFMPNGNAVTTFSIAVGESWKTESGEKQERTTWVNVVTYNKLAEICAEYLGKASQVFVSGKLQIRKYTDKDGNERTATEINAREMKMLGGRADKSSDDAAAHAKASQPAKPTGSIADMGDDIPFNAHARGITGYAL